jgi:hypothetical protein
MRKVLNEFIKQKRDPISCRGKGIEKNDKAGGDEVDLVNFRQWSK